jgi:hypothetical protein
MTTEVHVVLHNRQYDFETPETRVYHVYLQACDAENAVEWLNKAARERALNFSPVDYTDWYYYLPSSINEDLVEL